jgi:tyrosinase
MWNQCQHQGWYFVPWHRGYVFAFEAIIAKTIKDLGGPADWTLPYWNYLDASMEILLEWHEPGRKRVNPV